MSILDRFRGSAKKAKEQAEHVVDQHGDKIASGVEKTGQAVSKVTGHRFDDKIDKGVSKAKERLEGNGADAGSEPDSPTAPPPAADAGSEPDKGTSA
ncbi:MAG TPA: antitoxin [Nocardioidaceae bacterium]|nr:antitoxin [Nocardioidaceae bacterium]